MLRSLDIKLAHPAKAVRVATFSGKGDVLET